MPVVTAVFEAWPGAIMEKTVHGDTPLHVAIKHNAPGTILHTLLDAWRGAAEVKDCNGFTPLHSAMGSQIPQAVMLALFEAWPNAAREITASKRTRSPRRRNVPRSALGTVLEEAAAIPLKTASLLPPYFCADVRLM